ncbi:MAG: hypothetical protein ACTSQZ_03165 [Candidatus Thorarchaeota archaeon]
MLPLEKENPFSTMTTYEMFTKWLEVKWVRNLVFLLTPVGFLDAFYTMFLFQTIGPSSEYNPFVRAFLGSQWWFVWFLIDSLSFFLFVMLAGSYYLHTRDSLVNNRTGIISGLVAMRVGVVALNMLRFYGVFPAVLGGFLIGSFTYIVMDSLLDRTSDVSWKGFKQWLKHKLDNLHDYRLLRGANKTKQRNETQMSETINHEVEDVEYSGRGAWKQRVKYIAMAGIVFLAMPFILVLVADITGASAWGDIYGPLVFWNEVSGVAFLSGFVIICILIATIMHLILKSFEVQEGAW